MKVVLSGRVVSVVLIIVLLATVLNTYLVINVFTKVNDVGQTDSSGFAYVVTQSGSSVTVRNTLTKEITSGFASTAIAINYALSDGSTVFLKGTFDLSADLLIYNKWNAKLVGDNAVINANGCSIIVRGDDYTCSKYPLVSGLTLNNGTLRIENTFGATITNMLFKDSCVGLEFVNDNTWTEGSKVENCHFVNCREGIAFRTPKGVATGSYESTDISRCWFNQPDNSIAINVERKAELSCSQLQNLRIWIGEYGYNVNQTGLRMAGSMSQTMLIGVVFESFSPTPNGLFGIDVLNTAYTPPILGSDVSFLGDWTAAIHNPHGIWISGAGSSIFSRKDMPLHIGLNGKFGEPLTINPTPLKIVSFKPKVVVDGSFKSNEKVTVRIRLSLIDGTYTEVVKTFTSNAVLWLSDDDLLELFPSQNIITAIVIDATTNLGDTGVNVGVSGYGISG
jgi:hypothetical protein